MHVIARTLVIFGAALGTGAPALAADPPIRSSAPIAAVPPAFSWSGFYLGANAGAAIGHNPGSFTDPTFGPVGWSGGSGADFMGGAQIGYNHQFGVGSGFVIGLEADIQGIAAGKRGNYTLGAATYHNLSPQLDWFGTVRAKAGYGFGRVLVYATGGFAYGGGSITSFASGYPAPLPATTRTGYAVGGGVEYAFTSRLSAKLEGLYVGLNRQDVPSFYEPATDTYYGTSRSGGGFGLVRAGLNYRF